MSAEEDTTDSQSSSSSNERLYVGISVTMGNYGYRSNQVIEIGWACQKIPTWGRPRLGQISWYFGKNTGETFQDAWKRNGFDPEMFNNMTEEDRTGIELFQTDNHGELETPRIFSEASPFKCIKFFNGAQFAEYNASKKLAQSEQDTVIVDSSEPIASEIIKNYVLVEHESLKNQMDDNYFEKFNDPPTVKRTFGFRYIRVQTEAALAFEFNNFLTFAKSLCPEICFVLVPSALGIIEGLLRQYKFNTLTSADGFPNTKVEYSFFTSRLHPSHRICVQSLVASDILEQSINRKKKVLHQSRIRNKFVACFHSDDNKSAFENMTEFLEENEEMLKGMIQDRKRKRAKK